MNPPRVPTGVAVALWSATALAVTGYTLKAFFSTITGDGGAAIDPTPTQVASGQGGALANAALPLVSPVSGSPGHPAPLVNFPTIPGITPLLPKVSNKAAADLLNNSANRGTKLTGAQRIRLFAHPFRRNNIKKAIGG